MSELAEQYRNLRKIRGYFSGGEWNDDVDQHGGRLHTILIELSKALGHPPHTRAEIILLMGEPDAVRQQDSEEHLIYFWRGWHDYVYFVCRDQVVQEARWYAALE